MGFRYYTICLIQVILFIALIGLFYCHNTKKLNVIIERVDRVTDSIHTEVKAYPGQLFRPEIERQKDRRGNYWLSEQDFEVLEKALLYNNKRVETICTEARNEIANEITRLNTWMSLWMGILAVLGVFVPIIINIASIKSLEKEIDKQNGNLNTIRTNVRLAKSKADSAKTIAQNSKIAADQASDSVNGINTDIRLTQISVRLVYSLGALKDVENSYRIAYQLDEDRNFIVKHNIDDAILVFQDFRNFNDALGIDPQRNNLVKSVLRDFVLAFQKMQTLFGERGQLDAIEEINNAIIAFLDLSLQPNDDRAAALQRIIEALSSFKSIL